MVGCFLPCPLFSDHEGAPRIGQLAVVLCLRIGNRVPPVYGRLRGDQVTAWVGFELLFDTTHNSRPELAC